MGYRPRRAVQLSMSQRLAPHGRRLAPAFAGLALVCSLAAVTAGPPGPAAAPGIAQQAPVAEASGPPNRVDLERVTRTGRGGPRSAPTPSNSPSLSPENELERAADRAGSDIGEPDAATASPTPPASNTGTGSGSGESDSTAPCPSGSAVEQGLVPNAITVHREVCHRWPQITNYGGVRPDALPEHPSGRALDIMITSNATGWEIANYLQANAGRLGISQLIFDQRIWTVQRAGEGWRWMSDRGGVTANHQDHVHVTVYG